MKTEKKKWRDLALVAEFWFVMLLTVGAFLYGAWHAVLRLVAAVWF